MDVYCGQSFMEGNKFRFFGFKLVSVVMDDAMDTGLPICRGRVLAFSNVRTRVNLDSGNRTNRASLLVTNGTPSLWLYQPELYYTFSSSQEEVRIDEPFPEIMIQPRETQRVVVRFDLKREDDVPLDKAFRSAGTTKISAYLVIKAKRLPVNEFGPIPKTDTILISLATSRTPDVGLTFSETYRIIASMERAFV
jgi:hypothetical protein